MLVSSSVALQGGVRIPATGSMILFPAVKIRSTRPKTDTVAARNWLAAHLPRKALHLGTDYRGRR